MSILLKRAYDLAQPSDGKRILIDRIWPRGVSKEKAKIDVWVKDAAPSTELRKWFGHDPAKWEEFRSRYKLELAQGDGLETLRQAAHAQGPVTLVYAAKDEEHNNAIVLRELLESKV